MGKILGIIIGIIVIGGIIFFAATSLKKNQSGINQQPTNSGGSAQSQTAGGKTVTTCSHYETGAQGFKVNDTSPIPADIATLGSGETLCGSIVAFNTVYYLTEKSDSQIESLYTAKMLANGCTVAAKITPAPGHEVYSLNISYACPDGHYYVGTGFKDNGYWVTFNPSR
ncbi:MAG: hypothetical protein ACHQT7_00985 [Candidatus Levyibacteriota bacterium]